MHGFAYLLGNESMPGLFKIGFTRHDPYARAAQLSRTSGVPSQFAVLCTTEHQDAIGLERRLHHFFADDRVSETREFFRFDGTQRFNGVDIAMAEMARLDALSYIVTDAADGYLPRGAADRLLLMQQHREAAQL